MDWSEDLNMVFWAKTGFQNLSSYSSSSLESLHDLVMVWLFVIILVVMLIGSSVFFNKSSFMMNSDSTVLEVTWTVIPMTVLVTIAVPSLNLLCQQDTFLFSPNYTTKLFSNQWNWQSEQDDQIDHLLDSDKIDELSSFEWPLILPNNKVIRVMLTSSDVLHSLGVPSLGIKLDSNPGRLNSTVFESTTLGLLSGSCYELCGAGHSAMPIYMLVI